jgi:hypothetical protein
LFHSAAWPFEHTRPETAGYLTITKFDQGTALLLRRSEPCAADVRHTTTKDLGTTMADRTGLKFVGFIFASVTLAVMFATCMVVKGYADGAYTLDTAQISSDR